MTVEAARKLLLKQKNVEESEHHGHPDFRVNNKIFATLRPEQDRSVLRLPIEVAEASEKAEISRSRIVSRSGGMGWLSVDLKHWKVGEFEPLVQLAHGQMKQPPEKGTKARKS